MLYRLPKKSKEGESPKIKLPSFIGAYLDVSEVLKAADLTATSIGVLIARIQELEVEVHGLRTANRRLLRKLESRGGQDALSSADIDQQVQTEDAITFLDDLLHLLPNAVPSAEWDKAGGDFTQEANFSVSLLHARGDDWTATRSTFEKFGSRAYAYYCCVTLGMQSIEVLFGPEIGEITAYWDEQIKEASRSRKRKRSDTKRAPRRR